MANERWDDERLDRLADNVAANRQDIQVLLEGQARLQNLQIELGETQSLLGRVQELLTENLVELRAGQQRQERILDYLLRKDGERS